MTIVKTSTISAIALLLAALSAVPASAALTVDNPIVASRAVDAQSSAPRNVTLAAMQAYSWAKGQKSGSIKGPTPPPQPTNSQDRVIGTPGGAKAGSERMGIVVEDHK